MSIPKISATDERVKFQNKILSTTAAGAIVGGGYSAVQKNWLYKGMPSDDFVKSVSKDLSKDMTSDELKESFKINKFLEDAVNPNKNVEDLKPQIRNSKELSDAIKNSSEESVEDAISRVFSQPKDKVRQDLINLQLKTSADKKNSVNTALNLVNKNYDASGKKLLKSPATSERTFDLIKTAAKKIQIKTVAAATVLTGIAAGTLALVVSKVPDSENS